MHTDLTSLLASTGVTQPSALKFGFQLSNYELDDPEYLKNITYKIPGNLANDDLAERGELLEKAFPSQITHAVVPPHIEQYGRPSENTNIAYSIIDSHGKPIKVCAYYLVTLKNNQNYSDFDPLIYTIRDYASHCGLDASIVSDIDLDRLQPPVPYEGTAKTYYEQAHAKCIRIPVDCMLNSDFVDNISTLTGNITQILALPSLSPLK